MTPLKICKDSASAGGNAILGYSSGTELETSKGSLGHHAIVTSADYDSQKAILEVIGRLDPDAHVMTEEHAKPINPFLDGKNFLAIGSARAYIIDELCGSSGFNTGHYEWSISVGYLENLKHIAGAVYAPKVLGGALFYALKGNGAFLRTPETEERLHVSNRKLKDSYLIFGVDCFLTRYPIHNKLVNVLSDKARTSNSNGSCPLPLGLVAAGFADALIQPPQSPWDYAAGKLLVEEAGGKVIFYEIQGGKINPVERLEARHYNPNIKSVGFIAANPILAEQIMNHLLRIK